VIGADAVVFLDDQEAAIWSDVEGLPGSSRLQDQQWIVHDRARCAEAQLRLADDRSANDGGASDDVTVRRRPGIAADCQE